MSFRLVIVDDDDVERYLVRRTVRKWNPAVTVQEIARSPEALARFGGASPDPEPPGCAPPPVLLLDINMPEMTGIELLQALARQASDGGELPPVVIMLSSSAHVRDREQAEATGLVSGFVIKPLTPADLDDITRLRDAFIARGGRREVQVGG